MPANPLDMVDYPWQNYDTWAAVIGIIWDGYNTGTKTGSGTILAELKLPEHLTYLLNFGVN